MHSKGQTTRAFAVSKLHCVVMVWVGNSVGRTDKMLCFCLLVRCARAHGLTDCLFYAVRSIWRSNFQKKAVVQTVHQFEQLQMTCLVRLDFTMFNLAVLLRFWICENLWAPQKDCSCGIIRNSKLSKLSFPLSSTEKEKEPFQNHRRGTCHVLQIWIH